LSLPLSQKIIVDDYVEKKILKQFDESELEYIAINNRPEIRQESMQLENSKQLVKYYSNQLLPDFDIEASLAYAGLGGSKNSDYSTTILGVPRIASKYDEGFSDSMDTLKSLENKSWSIGAKLTIPLNNNAAEGRYEIAIAQRNQRISLLNKLLDSINLDTRNSYRELMSSIKNVESSKLYLSLKDEVLKIEEERFKIGMAKTRDVLEAQRDMIYAQAEYNKALSNYNISIASLEYSLGILIKERKIILDN
jgi:outer membrane protein TolC